MSLRPIYPVPQAPPRPTGQQTRIVKPAAATTQGSKTQPATARIQITASKTQPATARVSITASKTQSAVARVGIAGSKTQGAVARIQATVTKTQSAHATVRATVTKTQGATARIQATPSKTQPAVSRIQVTGSKTQPAHATVQATVTKTQSATAHISVTASVQVVHQTDYQFTSGTSQTVTIPSVTAGNTLVVTAGGEAIVSAKITSSSGTAFTKRTTYGGGAQDVSIQDFVASGGETAVYLSLNGAAVCGGTIFEVQGLGSYVTSSATNNGSGVSNAGSLDWHLTTTADTVISADSVLFAVAASSGGNTSGNTYDPNQFGPFGKVASQAAPDASHSWVSGYADVTSTGSFPANLSAGHYRPVVVGAKAGSASTGYMAAAAYAKSGSGNIVTAAANAIVHETSLPGSIQDSWYPGAVSSGTISGYTDKIGYAPGDTVNFKVDSANAAFRVEIYRVGWYGSETYSARNVVGEHQFITGTPTVQSSPTVDSTLGSTSCAWTTNATYSIPSDAAPGVYVAIFRRQDAGHTTEFSQGIFIVRDTTALSGKLVVVVADTTWQAYNQWGSVTDTSGPYSVTGRNLYGIGTDLPTVNNAHRAYAVSYDRPLIPGSNLNTMFWDSEIATVLFAESMGYDVSYVSCIDLENDTTLLENAGAVWISGHHEYWTTNMYDAVRNGISHGVNTIFTSSNTALWHTRFAAADTAKRTMICYKDSLSVDLTAGFDGGTGRDPVTYTGTWRDPRTSTPNNPDIRRENALQGQIFYVNGAFSTGLIVDYADKGKPMWRNSPGVQSLTSGTSFTSKSQLGDELDYADGSSGQPANIAYLSTTPVTSTTMGNKFVNAQGSVYTFSSSNTTFRMSMYRDNSGALVFDSGGWRVLWGVSTYYGTGSIASHNSTSYLDSGQENRNGFICLLYDFGIHPTRLPKLDWVTISGVATDTDPATGAPGPGRDAIATAYGLSTGSNKTQSATARIQVTGSKTQTAHAAIQATVTKTQTATARIQITPTKTQGAVARVQATRSSTQSATARIQVTGTKTQGAVSRIQATVTKTQSATAHINAAGVLTKTQTAVASIRATVTKTQPATARVQITPTKTQPATARVQIIGTKSQTATAHITVLGAGTKTQTAVASIRATVTKTQSAVGRIQVAGAKTQPATARIAITPTKTQPAVSRIRATVTKTQSATAHVLAIGTRIFQQTATARIRPPLERTLVVPADDRTLVVPVGASDRVLVVAEDYRMMEA